MKVLVCPISNLIGDAEYRYAPYILYQFGTSMMRYGWYVLVLIGIAKLAHISTWELKAFY